MKEYRPCNVPNLINTLSVPVRIISKRTSGRLGILYRYAFLSSSGCGGYIRVTVSAEDLISGQIRRLVLALLIFYGIKDYRADRFFIGFQFLMVFPCTFSVLFKFIVCFFALRGSYLLGFLSIGVIQFLRKIAYHRDVGSLEFKGIVF